MPPPSDSGLKVPCAGASSATQNDCASDGELGDDRLVLLRSAHPILLDGPEGVLVELDGGASAPHGELGHDARRPVAGVHGPGRYCVLVPDRPG